MLARKGTARVIVVLNPRGDFGREPDPQALKARRRRMDGRARRDTASAGRGPGRRPRRPTGTRGKALTLSLTLQEGAHHDFVLVLADGAAPIVEAPDPEWAWQGVEAEWRERIPELEDTVAQRDARHAYAVLSGLTSSGGGMVAAATTSLPERARGGRNYDYRYVWIRDQCYTGQAVAKAGPYPLMDDAVRFVTERLLEDGTRAQAGLHDDRRASVPDQRRLEPAGLPGRYGHRR